MAGMTGACIGAEELSTSLIGHMWYTSHTRDHYSIALFYHPFCLLGPLQIVQLYFGLHASSHVTWCIRSIIQDVFQRYGTGSATPNVLVVQRVVKESSTTQVHIAAMSASRSMLAPSTQAA